MSIYNDLFAIICKFHYFTEILNFPKWFCLLPMLFFNDKSIILDAIDFLRIVFFTMLFMYFVLFRFNIRICIFIFFCRFMQFHANDGTCLWKHRFWLSNYLDTSSNINGICILVFH